jgi:pyruvate dehydrogenase E2 component (dihydrolipoyllysine-residue acetyltransferase)
MATDVTMPRLSDSMEEGTILKWLVEEGDEVKKGQEIVEIETDKANMTYESDTEGTLIEIVANEGDTLALGEVIARIGDADEKPSGGGEEEGSDEDEDEDGEEGDEEEEAEEEAEDESDGGEDESDAGEDDEAQSAEEEEEPEPARASASEDGSGDGRVKASPVARRMAREMGVELATLEGSGPGGRIVKADVEAAAEGGAPEREAEDGKPAEGDGKPAKEEEPEKAAAKGDESARGETETHDLTKLQRTVSRRMAESKATAPDFALTAQVDMTLCVELRRRLKEVSDPAPSINDMIVKAAANALREHPRVNGAYRDGKFELYSRVNVGVAVAAQDTLVVPTIHDADKRALGEISRRARELIEKVREGKITPPELSGGTFTVSNLGMYGIDEFTAVINPPQAALLTVGSLKKRPVVDEDGRIVARDSLVLTLVCDHRILYGADGAQFLARVRELLEQPLALAL